MFLKTEERPQGETQIVPAKGKLKLSEAIRIGARLRPRCSGALFEDGKSCALGAALEGFGYAPVEFGSLGYFEQYELLNNLMPSGFDNGDIWTRNDRGDTRESIADWLASQGL